MDTPAYKSWSGYSFEQVCLYHVSQIKKALGIGMVYTEISSLRISGTSKKEGFQIDLIIDRKDESINLCEIKFYNKGFTITEDYAKQLRNKRGTFQDISKTKKLIFLTMITTFGLKENEHSLGIDNSLTMDVLF